MVDNLLKRLRCGISVFLFLMLIQHFNVPVALFHSLLEKKVFLMNQIIYFSDWLDTNFLVDFVFWKITRDS